jgi:hypothetical protein
MFLACGVAYNATLISYRADAKIVVEGFQDDNDAKNVFTALTNSTPEKDISMSVGTHYFSRKNRRLYKICFK